MDFQFNLDNSEPGSNGSVSNIEQEDIEEETPPKSNFLPFQIGEVLRKSGRSVAEVGQRAGAWFRITNPTLVAQNNKGFQYVFQGAPENEDTEDTVPRYVKVDHRDKPPTKDESSNAIPATPVQMSTRSVAPLRKRRRNSDNAEDLDSAESTSALDGNHVDAHSLAISAQPDSNSASAEFQDTKSNSISDSSVPTTNQPTPASEETMGTPFSVTARTESTVIAEKLIGTLNASPIKYQSSSVEEVPDEDEDTMPTEEKIEPLATVTIAELEPDSDSTSQNETKTPEEEEKSAGKKVRFVEDAPVLPSAEMPVRHLFDHGQSTDPHQMTETDLEVYRDLMKQLGYDFTEQMRELQESPALREAIAGRCRHVIANKQAQNINTGDPFQIFEIDDRTGIGIFAMKPIPKNTEIIREVPILTAGLTWLEKEAAFQLLPPTHQAAITTLSSACTCPTQTTCQETPLMKIWNINTPTLRTTIEDDTNLRRRWAELRFGSLYQLASRINHACLPNCVRGFDHSGNIVIKAITDILPGDQLTVAYINVWGLDTATRRRVLLENYRFLCRCRMCSDRADFSSCTPEMWMGIRERYHAFEAPEAEAGTKMWGPVSTRTLMVENEKKVEEWMDLCYEIIDVTCLLLEGEKNPETPDTNTLAGQYVLAITHLMATFEGPELTQEKLDALIKEQQGEEAELALTYEDRLAFYTIRKMKIYEEVFKRNNTFGLDAQVIASFLYRVYPWVKADVEYELRTKEDEAKGEGGQNSGDAAEAHAQGNKDKTSNAPSSSSTSNTRLQSPPDPDPENQSVELRAHLNSLRTEVSDGDAAEAHAHVHASETANRSSSLENESEEAANPPSHQGAPKKSKKSKKSKKKSKKNKSKQKGKKRH